MILSRRTISVTFTLFVGLGAIDSKAEPVSRADHLLIISIDGLRGDWAANPDRHNLKIPTLRKLAARGTVAEAVRGIFPSVTYPSHTTLVTGCRPARHGIMANTLFDPPTTRPTERWYWDYRDIRVPTIIDAAKAERWSTAAVGWPVTLNAPADILFPEVWEPGHHDEAVAEMSVRSRPPDLLSKVLTKYDLLGGADRDFNRTNVARYIVDRYKPRLMLVHFIELDHDEHEFGPESAQAHESLERIDGYVAQLLDQYDRNNQLDKTVVAIVSDHGFLPTQKVFHVNALLSDKHLIQAGDDPKGPASDYDAVGWMAGGSCAIVLGHRDDEATLVRVREALAPYTGKPDSPIRRILEREEIARLGSNTQAALMLDAGDGFTFGSHLRGELVTDSAGGGHPVRGMHGQMPDRPSLEATFIAAGPGIAVGGKISEMRMIDVAPTLCAIVRLSFPQAEGTTVASVFEKPRSESGN